MGGNWFVEVLFLAMLAGFIALRLVSVLGRRTGHESAPSGEGFRPATAEVAQNATPLVEGRARPAPAVPEGTPAEAADGLTAIAGLDGAFDPARFLDGANGAYAMILSAFWSGDLTEVEPYVSDEIGLQFRRAIDARGGADGARRIVGVDGARIVAAHLDGNMAEVVVRFDARIAEGGTTHAARDEWTFRRHVSASDPNWLLVATESHGE